MPEIPDANAKRYQLTEVPPIQPHTKEVRRTPWRAHKAGKLDRVTFRAWMAPVRAQVEDLLARAVASNIDRLSGSCADILAHKAALWTFVDRDDVEPTNNHGASCARSFYGADVASGRRATAATCSPSG